MMKKLFFLIVMLISITTKAQVKIGDNPSTVGSSSVLELESTDKALVLPRVNSVSSITVPQNGMLIYETSTHCIKGFANGEWTECFAFTSPPSLRVSQQSSKSENKQKSLKSQTIINNR